MKPSFVASGARTARIALGVTLALATPAAPQPHAEEMVERFDAEVMAQGRSNRRGRMEIRITRWSTPDEKATLSVLMQLEDPKALVEALEDLGPLGHIRFRNASAQPLRYARETFADGKRTIVLFTDRSLAAALDRTPPGSDTESIVSGNLSSRRARASEGLIEIVQLEVNEEGRGEGSWATGVRIGVAPETGVPGILSSASVSRLRKVRPAE